MINQLSAVTTKLLIKARPSHTVRDTHAKTHLDACLRKTHKHKQLSTEERIMYCTFLTRSFIDWNCRHERKVTDSHTLTVSSDLGFKLSSHPSLPPSLYPSIHPSHCDPDASAIHPRCCPSRTINSSISAVLFIDFGRVAEQPDCSRICVH